MNETERTVILAALKQKTVTLPDQTHVRALGQGTWRMGEDQTKRQAEIDALHVGLDSGMELIDTAEMYGEGASEQLIREVLKERRDEVFLVSKVYPHNAGGEKLRAACERTLENLGTDYLDLYLLHWRGSIPLQETVDGLEQLKAEGKIRRWGVSNFDVKDMKELLALDKGDQCAVNQVLYHLGSRGIEYELMPLLKQHSIPVMAYCPLAEGGSLRDQLLDHPTVERLAEEHGVQPAQILLAWAIRSGDVIAIPKAGQAPHVEENGKAALIDLTEEELAALDEAFPAPTKKEPLDIV
ncbi:MULTISPECIES: aldo/keto reductase [Exiguobacterium]|uniref:aldo/keto reductase n=1 Tax=Exiguobacterium TaxID=33986 RepID=UPI0004787252|nr:MULTISPECIES: aldo/keto reductase [Exiguobacterium]MCT4780728.1 aldo/keto reductase [Exiguobacterium soli]